jgi:hypothetical protein
MKNKRHLLLILTVTLLNLACFIGISPSFRSDMLVLVNTINDDITEFLDRIDNGMLIQLNNGANQESETPSTPDIISEVNNVQLGKSKTEGSLSTDASRNEVVGSANMSSPGPSNQVDQHDSTSAVASESLTVWEEQGFIYVTSNPEGAWVMIDDYTVGQAPVTVGVNSGGIYDVTVKLKYHATWRKYITVYPSEVTRIQADLKPGSGTLTIISIPQEADVLVDDEFEGKTPLTIKNLGAGMHIVHVVKGEIEYKEKVEVQSGENKILRATLRVLKSSIKIDSEPSSAKIYIDGVLKGTTPAVIDKVDIGEHQIVLVKGDSLANVDSIVIHPDKDNQYSASLTKKSKFTDTFSSRLTIDSELENTHVYIDGSYCGKTPLEIADMLSGEHETVIFQPVRNGSYYYKSKVLLDSNESKELVLKAEDFRFKKYF